MRNREKHENISYVCFNGKGRIFAETLDAFEGYLDEWHPPPAALPLVVVAHARDNGRLGMEHKAETKLRISCGRCRARLRKLKAKVFNSRKLQQHPSAIAVPRLRLDHRLPKAEKLS